MHLWRNTFAGVLRRLYEAEGALVGLATRYAHGGDASGDVAAARDVILDVVEAAAERRRSA